MNYKIGIIGMGKMGKIRKRELDIHPNFEVVAICDLSKETKEQFPDLFFSEDWSDILDQNIDAVVVCTFNKIVPSIICKALEMGLHVFSEKPPGTCVEDVREIRAAEAKAKNKIVKFGFNHRFHYNIMEAKSIIDSGRYGKVMWARGIYGKAGSLDFPSSWRSDPVEAGGGILLDQGIHMLDLLRYFVGEFKEVKSFTNRSYWKESSNEDNAFALLKTKDDQVAMLHSSSTHWKHKFSLDIYLEHGYVTLNGILSSTRSYGEESISYAKKQFEDEATAVGRPREETIYFDRDDSWKLEIDEFYECLEGREKFHSGNTIDALQVMTLIEAIYKASGTGSEILADSII